MKKSERLYNNDWRAHAVTMVACLSFLTSSLPHSLTALAGQWPSLFRGVVVADSPLGVRVVQVEETSQAYQADLRPEDIVVRIGNTEIHSIDAFATLSSQLKGRVRAAKVVIFRNGTPRELTVHLYSYPILRAWGIAFLPEHDIRFAEAKTGWTYWNRLGRGFEGAGKLPEALNAYLNGLHNLPTDTGTAFTVAILSSTVSQQRLAAGALAEGLPLLRQSVAMMEKLFDAPLTQEQLLTIRRQLEATLAALRAAVAPPPPENRGSAGAGPHA